MHLGVPKIALVGMFSVLVLSASGDMFSPLVLSGGMISVLVLSIPVTVTLRALLPVVALATCLVGATRDEGTQERSTDCR